MDTQSLQPKSPLASKTYVGLATVVVGWIFVNVELPFTQTEVMASVECGRVAVGQTTQLFGVLVAAYGRAVAEGPLSFLKG